VGKQGKHASEYVRQNRDDLSQVPSAFFSVSLAAHSDEENAERYVKDFEENTGWHPAKVGILGGALLIPSTGSSSGT
jgi:menaquinone-dependent protoporphyrinogen oxidase